MRIFPTKNGHERSASLGKATAEYQSDSSSKKPVSLGAFGTSEKTNNDVRIEENALANWTGRSISVS